MANNKKKGSASSEKWVWVSMNVGSVKISFDLNWTTLSVASTLTSSVLDSIILFFSGILLGKLNEFWTFRWNEIIRLNFEIMLLDWNIYGFGSSIGVGQTKCQNWWKGRLLDKWLIFQRRNYAVRNMSAAPAYANTHGIESICCVHSMQSSASWQVVFIHHQSSANTLSVFKWSK